MIYTLKELAAHHDATGSVVSRYVPESDYKKLQQERDALAAQVDSLLDNCKAFVKKEFELLKEVERLEIELKKRDEQNAALAATVEALREALKPAVRLMRTTGRCSGWHEKADQIESLANQELTSQQHLRDVQAEAVSTLCAKLSGSIMSVPVPEYGYDHNIKMRNAIINVISSAADQHAESVRRGE